MQRGACSSLFEQLNPSITALSAALLVTTVALAFVKA